VAPVPLLLLDLTGVLFDYHPRARTEALAAATGVPYDEVRARLFTNGFFAQCIRGEVTEAQERDYFRAQLDWHAPDEEVNRIWATGWTPRMDTLALLGAVPRTVERALLTNNDPVMRVALGTEFPALTDVVTTMLSAENLGAAKPERAAFTRALELLGAQPEDAHFVDDTAANVEAAIGVGIRARQFVHNEQLRADLLDWGLLA
jgi:putative hydrolase of the HAD superfamily